MADYFLENVKCPFFLESNNSDSNKIKCEGIANGTSVHLVFKRSRVPYYTRFCCANYENCAIYEMLDKKYPK